MYVIIISIGYMIMASSREFKNCSLLNSSMQDTELGVMLLLPNKN